MGIDSYKAAAIQFEPRLFDKEKNCLELIELIKEAAESGAKLITTPEMAISGYCFFNEEEAARMAEPVSGKTVSLFKNLSSSLNIYLVLGMPEQDEESGLLYNSAIFIGPKGVLGVHRKTHSYISEPKWAAPGNNGHKVYDTPLGKIAILICMDIHFLETARVVAVEGADIICHISNWLAEKTPAPYWISRAYENNCYLLESNRWGLERGVQFSGGSCIISPNGDIISQIDTENGIVYANIDLNESRKMKKNVYSTLECRRPNLYRELQKNTFLWNPLDYFNLYNNNPISKGGSGKVSVVQDNFSENKNDNIKKILILI
ncbi:nitrilase-related carbon-nitrogen hydrolase, partial [Acetobacter sp. DsW_059]|uniref:nitrilase-related carbon-nitrogen hydrolase n=1 Tax=Acetobacter sp. DsW_059 TaxID=1670661 RepID=UPI000B6E8CF1